MQNIIDIEHCYFHGLAGGIPFWDADRVATVGIQQLRKIIETKGIYSRKILNEKYGITYGEKEAIYNGDDYISLCIKNPDNSEFEGKFCDLDPAFFRYVSRKIGIVLKADIINKYTFREGKYDRLPGERQVLNSIDISDITAIIIGVSDKIKYLPSIEKILEGTDIPIVDIEGNILTVDQKKEFYNIEK